MSTIMSGPTEPRSQHPPSARTLDSLADDMDNRATLNDAGPSKHDTHGSAPSKAAGTAKAKPSSEAQHAAGSSQAQQSGGTSLSIKQRLLIVNDASRATDATSSEEVNPSLSSLAAYLRARVFAHGGELVFTLGGGASEGESLPSLGGEVAPEAGDLGLDADPEAPDDGSLSHVTPDEYARILANLKEEGQRAGCAVTVLLEKDSVAGDDGKAQPQAWIMLRQIPEAAHDFVEIRVACVGNVDAGKSTTLGVLTKGGLDDGRGKARVNLFRHKHETESGRTSSVGMELLGLTETGDHVISAVGSKEEGRRLSWEEVCARSAKIVNFLDLAGHERYLRTTIGGLTANMPEYGMLMVGANAGLIGMSKEHLGVALALSIPVFITITKIDMCPPHILEATIKQLSKVLRSPGCRKTPVFVESMEQVVDCALRLSSERICPIFQVSNVTGHNLDLLRSFLNILPQESATKFDTEAPFELQISDIFSVPFVGTVVSGVITSGTVRTGDNLLIGPDSLGQFLQTAVRSIERKRVSVASAWAGQSASFALKRVRRNQVRKGMVMVAPRGPGEAPPQAHMVFDAEILCLHHATTLSVGSCMVLHAAGIRQTVRIIAIAKASPHGSEAGSSATGAPQAQAGAGVVSDEKPVIRTGDRAKLRLQFLRSPEYIKPGVRLITREGRTRLIGRVASVGDKEALYPPGV